MLGALGLAGVAGCGGGDDDGADTTPTAAATTTTVGTTTTAVAVTTAAPVITTIAPTAPAATTATPATTVGGPIVGEYTVQAGDNLSVIATRAGVSVAEIAQFNGIANINQIQAGQVLRIPEPGTVVVTTAPPLVATTVAAVPPAEATVAPTSATG